MTDAFRRRPTPSFRANNDGAKIPPEGDVTAEEGRNGQHAHFGRSGVSDSDRLAGRSLCPFPEAANVPR